MEREVTIRDVARAAWVSPSTVSNLLNGRDGRMRSGTKQRILRTIDELGYRPSRVARQLRTGRTQVIGLVVPSVANPFWGAFARAIEEAALRKGQQTLLCNSEREPDRERTYVDELWAGGVEAVIIGSSLPSLDHLRPHIERGLRLVAFDRESQDDDDPPSLCSVSVDNALGCRLATEHLLALGHRRIGFISGAIATVSRVRRLAGYREALKAAGVRASDELVWANPRGYGDTDSADLGRQGMAALLRLPNLPTAVVAINDMYVIGACAAVREAGLRVPDDVSVVGFDDIALAKLFNPPLTTVHQPLVEMARLAVDAAGGEERSWSPMTPRLVVRASTARFDNTGRNH